MKRTQVQYQWQPDSPWRRFRSGVSLHSHTHCSRESLSFIYQIAARVGFIDAAIQRGRRRHGVSLDFARGWWTPPLVPRAAWDLERDQIESALGLQALVSLTDHDSIEAPCSLRALAAPFSVEWTVPFAGSMIHLGIHNLPPAWAGQAMQAMEAYTSQPNDDTLGDLLRWIHNDPQTLIVFNHPLWDEGGRGDLTHHQAGEKLLRRHGDAVHALELNGLRPWRENREAADLAQRWGKPLVSGGDRHGLEPNVVLNLTAATNFAEFVEEVRRDGRSEILITAQYRQPLFWRTFDAVLDAVGDHERHGLGWKIWDQRVFYLCDDGVVRSLKEIWGERSPGIIRHFTTVARALHQSWLQRSLRVAVGFQQEMAL